MKYFVGRLSEGAPYRVYSSERWLHNYDNIWEGDNYDEGLKVAMGKNAEVRAAKAAKKAAERAAKMEANPPKQHEAQTETDTAKLARWKEWATR